MSERMETIAQELMALRTAQGVINPTEVVAWAKRNKKSKLHAHLTWDDAVAAERHRVWQVRALISVHIVDNVGQRRFVSLSIDRQVGGYRPMEEVMARPDLREVMLADALAELERLQKRYDQLSELSTVWVETHKVAERSRQKEAA